jgi:hypothetical protein
MMTEIKNELYLELSRQHSEANKGSLRAVCQVMFGQDPHDTGEVSDMAPLDLDALARAAVDAVRNWSDE